jgi:hypothetical protein
VPGRDRQQVPGPGRAGHSRPGQAAEVALHPVRGGQAERALAVRASPITRSPAAPAPRSCPGSTTTPATPVRHRPCPGHRAETDACNFQHPPGAEARSFIASDRSSRPIGMAADLQILP